MLVLIDWKVVNDFRAGITFQLKTLSFPFENHVVNNTVLYEAICNIISIIENLGNLPNILKQLLLLQIHRVLFFFQFQVLERIYFALDGWCRL